MFSPVFAVGMPSGPELLVIVIVLVVVFGARKIPEIARSLGRSSGEFKRGIKEGDAVAKAKTEEIKKSIIDEAATSTTDEPTPEEK